jgi:hypothetical protein
MSTQYIVPTAGTIDPGACFGTWQETLNAFAAALRIPFPSGYTQILVSSSNPDPGDIGKVWLKTTGGGAAIGFYFYSGGAWRPINPPNVYFGSDVGAVNAYLVNALTPVYPTFTPDALNTGVFFVKIANTNTGASTIQINAYAAVAVKVAGADLWPGALKAGHWYAMVFDGTNFEVTGISQLTTSDIAAAGTDGAFLRTRTVSAVLTTVWETSIFESTATAFPGATVPLSWYHGLGVVPKFFRVVAVCKTAEFNYLVGDEIPVEALYATGGTQSATTWANTTAVGFNSTAAFKFTDKTAGTAQTLTTANWNLKAYAFK